MTTTERILFFTIIVIVGLFFGLLIKSKNDDKDFDRMAKRVFVLGWLTGANQVRDLKPDCAVDLDMLNILLYKDSLDFSYLIDSTKDGN